MKRLSAFVFLSAALAAAPLSAATAAKRMPVLPLRGTRAVIVQQKSTAALCTGTCYSVELPVVTRVQGTAFFRTSVDITNNTGGNITATFQYTYAAGGGLFHTTATPIALGGFDNFHQDDIVAYLGTLGLLQPGADQSSFGTFLVTFDNLPSKHGWEGTVTGRTYSPDAGGLGTNGIAYLGSLFFESSSGTLVGLIRDTIPAPTIAGALRTNLGIRNTDIFPSANPDNDIVSVTLTFYDTATGALVGNAIPMDNLAPGEVRQINNVFVVAAIPTSVTSVIVFADVVNASLTQPTVEGYINILDDGTKDGAFYEMKCSSFCQTF